MSAANVRVCVHGYVSAAPLDAALPDARSSLAVNGQGPFTRGCDNADGRAPSEGQALNTSEHIHVSRATIKDHQAEDLAKKEAARQQNIKEKREERLSAARVAKRITSLISGFLSSTEQKNSHEVAVIVVSGVKK